MFNIRYLSLGFVEIVTSGGRRIIFDPWTKSEGNPHCPIETKEIKQTDLILVSHDHKDHIGSAANICKATGALIAGGVETMDRLVNEEGLLRNQVVNNGTGYLPGGGVDLEWVRVTAVPAHHTSDTSCAMGTIVEIENDIIIYHTGDTCLTGEMEIYGRMYSIDILFVPIGDIGTMDARQAIECIRLVKPKKVMPIHFEWNPKPKQTLDKFIELCRDINPKVEIVIPQLGKYIKM